MDKEPTFDEFFQRNRGDQEQAYSISELLGEFLRTPRTERDLAAIIVLLAAKIEGLEARLEELERG